MIDLQFYRSLLMRRLPVMLALLITCSAFGLVWAVKAPPIYSTAARLLVEEPQIAESDNSPSPSESLDVIEQQLMTRANLIDIANKLNVFRGDATLSVDDKVARMRAGTSIRRIAGRDQATMMTVGFTSTDPRIAAAVVNEFTTLVLSTNTRNRVGLAENRLAFYQQEVQRLGDDLDQQNAKILEFKQKNADALPENLRYSQDRQSLLQERVSRLESDLSTLQAQKQDMVRLFEQTGSIRQNDTPQTPEQQQLSSLQAELNNTLGVYAEGSPKVQALRARIAAAQKALEAASPADEAGQTGNSLLDINLAQLDTRIETIGKDLAQANRQLQDLSASISATATNSIALGALERDQANIQARYNAAVADLGAARTAERIESSARGQRITVIESANVPSRPSGPNRKKLALMGVGLGLGLAGGFFALMELLNRAIRRPAEMRARFQITPLAVIPYIETRQERRHRQGVALVLILAVLIVIPLGLWGIHTQYMPLDILAQKVVNRLGLG